MLLDRQLYTKNGRAYVLLKLKPDRNAPTQIINRVFPRANRRSDRRSDSKVACLCVRA